MAASEGPDREPWNPHVPTPWRVVPAMQPAPCVYNRAVIAGLDFLLVELARRDMTAVLVLGNMWPWSGGFAQYVSWATGLPVPPPGARGTFETARYLKFASLLQHEGCDDAVAPTRPLRGDANERDQRRGLPRRPDDHGMGARARAAADEAVVAYRQWINQTAALIKSLDANHLVTIGSEGRAAVASAGVDFSVDYAFPSIDYDDPPLAQPLVHARRRHRRRHHRRLRQWLRRGHRLPAAGARTAVGRRGGAPRVRLVSSTRSSRTGSGSPSYSPASTTLATTAPATPTTGRADATSSSTASSRTRSPTPSSPRSSPTTRAPAAARRREHDALRRDRRPLVVSGVVVWSWGGEARPRAGGGAWQPGDDLLGDPVSDVQGAASSTTPTAARSPSSHGGPPPHPAAAAVAAVAAAAALAVALAAAAAAAPRRRRRTVAALAAAAALAALAAAAATALAAAAAAASPPPPPPPPPPPGRRRRRRPPSSRSLSARGTRLTRLGEPYRFVGANLWQGCTLAPRRRRAATAAARADSTA